MSTVMDIRNEPVVKNLILNDMKVPSDINENQ